jgi:serine/threonine-protein kinase
VNINALPWADVLIDGVRIGDTPLANVMLRPGDHAVVFRHPELGEKRQTVRVTLRESPRISVDMRAP